jgi:hypothetical protein
MRRDLVLRLLLSLLLVLNGIGSAVAGVRMALPVEAPAQAAMDAADGEPPCHQAAIADPMQPASMPMPAGGDHPHGDGDCCASGACTAAGCDCPCVALAATLPPLPALPMLLPVSLPPTLLRVPPHPSPPRHDPDRPPIA